mgnify:CR=1 FL=1|jgi:hypothetical protein
MTGLLLLFRAVAGGVVFIVGLAIAGEAMAECVNLPKVAWWGDLSHEKIVRYVDKKHGGDWGPYIGKWDRQVEKLQGIYERESAIIVTKDKIRLENEELAEYIEKVQQRVEVVRCLASNMGSQTEDDVRELASFATAAGSNEPTPAKGGEKTRNRTAPAPTAIAARAPLNIEVSARCQGGTARFQVVNKGIPWPGTSTILIYDTDTELPVTQRRLRLTSGQSASFKIKKPETGATPLALWVKPSWSPREFLYDATIACG